MAEPHPLILSLRCAGLKDVDTCNLDEVHNMWAALSRAKNCIDGGDRLEYLSWRIYSREILARKPIATELKPQNMNLADSPQHETSPSETEPEGNDSDYESYSDDSDDEVVDAVRQKSNVNQRDIREPKNTLREAQPAYSSAPQLMASKSKTATSHPHRRISSIELQHLFKEARKLDPSGLKQCALSAKQQFTAPTEKPKPVQIPEKASVNTKSDVPATESSLALNAYQTRFGTPAVQRAPREPVREASKEPVAIRDSSSSLYNPLPETGSSTAVRGFSPSSVSVSVFMNRGLPQPDDKESSTEGHKNEGGNSVTWKKASLPREKIFFIEAESDSDASSIAGSPDNNHQRSQTGANNKNSGKHLEIIEPADNDPEDDEYEDLDDEEDGEGYGSSGWDDTSGDEENSDEERRPENMFKERAVPSKPLLKRSLLSSLFVNDMNQATPSQTQTQASEEHDKGITLETQPSTSPSDQSGVTAPVDILLGAAVAPHIPLPVASPRTVRRDMLNTELSQSLRDTMKQSRNYDVDKLFQERPSNSRSVSESAADLSVSETSDLATPTISSLHMTARPEMYRASTDNGVSYRRPSDERGAWQSQHEDIYDPMNYHSRGW